MLNEILLMASYSCPVCKRYYSNQYLPEWWCPYCGSTLERRKIKELEKRIKIIEKKLQNNDIN